MRVVAAVLIVLVGVGSTLLVLRMQRSAPATGSPTPEGGPSATSPTPAPVPTREPQNVVEHVVVFLKRRRLARAVLTLVSVALLAGATWSIGYPFYTNLYQSREQSRLDRQLASPSIKDAYLTRSVPIGDSLTRIKIPRIEVDTIVVEGTTASALRAGAGHYVHSPLPCEVGNVAIAGHRTTYGKPFHNLDLLEAGDTIVLETPIGTCTYEVEDTIIVTPDDVSVVENTPDEARLTLTTCHPKGSARQRLVLRATMVSAQNFDA